MTESQITINHQIVHYKTIGQGDEFVILLHGWGLSSEKYIPLIQNIIKQRPNLIFIVPDLPGFGKSDEPQTNWEVGDYAQFIHEFINQVIPTPPTTSSDDKKMSLTEKKRNNKKSKIIIIAHSFGGRIALKYITQHPHRCKKLFLTGAAGIKRPLSPKKQILTLIVKTSKPLCNLPLIKQHKADITKLFYNKVVQEQDYYRASSRMKKIMQNVIQEDLTATLPHISIPTILIWGADDRSTPLKDAEVMKNNIINSRLFVIKNANHSLPYNQPEKFTDIFLNNL